MYSSFSQPNNLNQILDIHICPAGRMVLPSGHLVTMAGNLVPCRMSTTLLADSERTQLCTRLIRTALGPSLLCGAVHHRRSSPSHDLCNQKSGLCSRMAFQGTSSIYGSANVQKGSVEHTRRLAGGWGLLNSIWIELTIL